MSPLDDLSYARLASQQIAQLPARSQEKYRLLKSESEDAGLLVNQQQERCRRLEGEVVVAQNAVADAHRWDGDVAGAEAVLTKVQQRYNSAIERRDKLNRVADSAIRLVNAIEDWARAGLPFYPAPIPEPQLQENETVEAALDRTRREILRLRGEVGSLSYPQASAQEAQELIRTTIAEKSARGQPKMLIGMTQPHVRMPMMSDVALGSLQILWPDRAGPMTSHPPPEAASDLLVWLFREQVEQRLLAMAQQQFTEGPSKQERLVKIWSLERELLRLEHVEERLVERGLEMSLPVARFSTNPYGILYLSPWQPEQEVLQAAE